MATARVPTSAAPHLLVGQTVHFRDRHRCWAAAIVGSDGNEHAQLFLFPLPPTTPMPQAPGGFVRHDAGRGEDSWHRLGECEAVPASSSNGRKRRRRSTRREG